VKFGAVRVRWCVPGWAEMVSDDMARIVWLAGSGSLVAPPMVAVVVNWRAESCASIAGSAAGVAMGQLILAKSASFRPRTWAGRGGWARRSGWNG